MDAGKRMGPFALVLAVVLAPFAAAQTVAVENTQRYTHPNLGLTVVVGTARVPSDAFWLVDEPAGGPLRSVQLMPEDPGYLRRQGRRTHEVELQRKLDLGRRPMGRAHWALRGWSRERRLLYDREIAEARAELQKAEKTLEQAKKQAALVDLTALKRDVERAQQTLRRRERSKQQAKERFAQLDEILERSPWVEDRGAGVNGPFYLVIPGVEPGSREETGSKEETEMILELRPYIDDGKHWVLYTSGSIRRVKIDPALLKKHDVEVRPLKPASAAKPPDVGAQVTYHAAAVLDGRPGAVSLTARDPVTGRTLALTWNVADATPGEPAVLQRWATARALMRWRPLLDEDGPLILSAWAERMKSVYGVAMPELGARNRRPDRGRGTSLFHVLGGRAAVRETLQMQRLTAAGEDTSDQTVPLADLPGVEVKSHPFQDMLGGKEGGRLAIADLVPPDRFFCYVARPTVSLDYLDSSGDFLSRLGGTATEQRIHYNLKARYLTRLGLTEEWARRLLNTGAVADLAVVTPDLFFIDGTDVTLIIRLSRPLLVRPLLVLMKLGGLGDDIQTVARVGGEAYWAATGPYLVMGTRRSEVARVLALKRANGEGSLGRSAEFRYMLTQLPLNERTVGTVYFSDPFIRRLTGPAVKIGQLRRLRARASMEALTAGALLCKADGVAGATDIERLVGLGYAPAFVRQGDITLGEDLVARSERYGTLAEMTPLLGNAIDIVTKKEAEAYESYRERYTRFWRQFFDPIAVRLEQTGAGDFALTTFILPLIDSSVYDGVREMAAVAPDPPLRVPVLDATPVMMLSMNLTERVWREFARDMLRNAAARARIATGLLDLLGPSVHLALLDSDAIVHFGSGDMLGAFGLEGMRFGRNAAPFLALAMVLTRPARIAIELADADAARELLRLSALRWNPPDERRGFWSEAAISLRETARKDRWLLAFDLFGMVHLRFGVEVQEGFLVLSNMPWGRRARVTEATEQPLNGAALALHPEALDAGLPGLHEAAMRKQAAAALQGMASLYPMLAAGVSNPGAATTLHRMLFGFAPLHPGEGDWRWRRGRIASTTFGTPFLPQQPTYEPGKPFGLLHGVGDLRLNMQLEQGGLRAVCSWTRP